MPKLEVLEVIPDLRKDQRAGPFWKMCGKLVECAELVTNLREPPRCRHEFEIETTEAARLWRWFQIVREEGYVEEPVDAIQVGSTNWRPVDGMHRASVLYVLGEPVPAFLVNNERPNPRDLYFDGIWKWR